MNGKCTFVFLREEGGQSVYRKLSEFSAKELRVPAGYIPQAVWAERHGYTPKEVAKLAGHGRLWVSREINATMKVGRYRFVHINAVVREPLQFQQGNRRGGDK